MQPSHTVVVALLVLACAWLLRPSANHTVHRAQHPPSHTAEEALHVVRTKIPDASIVSGLQKLKQGARIVKMSSLADVSAQSPLAGDSKISFSLVNQLNHSIQILWVQFRHANASLLTTVHPGTASQLSGQKGHLLLVKAKDVVLKYINLERDVGESVLTISQSHLDAAEANWNLLNSRPWINAPTKRLPIFPTQSLTGIDMINIRGRKFSVNQLSSSPLLFEIEDFLSLVEKTIILDSMSSSFQERKDDTTLSWTLDKFSAKIIFFSRVLSLVGVPETIDTLRYFEPLKIYDFSKAKKDKEMWDFLLPNPLDSHYDQITRGHNRFLTAYIPLDDQDSLISFPKHSQGLRYSFSTCFPTEISTPRLYTSIAKAKDSPSRFVYGTWPYTVDPSFLSPVPYPATILPLSCL